MNRVVIFLCLLILGISQTNAQDLNYAKKIIETLCSEEFHGRGYVNDGHLNAASLISEHFDSLGLETFDLSFFQHFEISVNTFPSELSLEVDGKSLDVGSEWLIHPASSSFEGTSECTYISKSDLGHRKSRRQIRRAIKKDKAFIVQNLDRSGSLALATLKKSYENLKIVELIDKPMWHMSSSVGDDFHVKIVKRTLSQKIRKINYHVDSDFLEKIETQNVLGYIPASEKTDSFFIYSAHYDHLGRMGADAYTPGANDNASGISMLLNLAAHYVKPENRPENHNLLFIAFGAEELGLKGAYHFVGEETVPLGDIKFLLNLDIVGTGDDGVQVVNSKIFEEEFEKLDAINNQKGYLEEIKLRGEAANSDHYPFYEKGVPCFFIYTLGGVQHYHDVFDRSETLPLTDYEDLFRLITDFEATF